ncbi:unnamed protein product [Haemonchus placei]|uniref:Uncharacterized protein n=1 Tax=Haemonchus placei TaxID=6290 RepID=A0A3P7XI40_HAEPC|nr:unnamed protein product [Haemonchus placei]
MLNFSAKHLNSLSRCGRPKTEECRTGTVLSGNMAEPKCGCPLLPLASFKFKRRCRSNSD